MNSYLTNKQIAFVIFGTIVGYGVVGLPKDVAEVGYTGGWIGIAISTIIASLFAIIIVYIGLNNKKQTLDEYSEKLFGKFITVIFKGIYTIYFFLTFSMITRISSEVIKLTILIRTPSIFISIMLLIAVLYAVLKGLTVLGRICEIYGVIIILSAIIVHLLMFFQGKMMNIKPFIYPLSFSEYFKLLQTTVIPFLGLEILLVVPLNPKTNGKKTYFFVAGMIIFIGALYILVVESCLSVMGVEGTVYHKDALIAAIRRVDVQFLNFLRRLDGVFIIAWVMAIFCTVVLFAYGAVFLVSRCCKSIPYNIVAVTIITLGLILSRIPESIDDVQVMLKLSGYLGIITTGIIPLLLLIRIKVKKQ